MLLLLACGGTVAAAPPPFRPRNPALCGICLLVTPYYCRLWDLVCFVFMSAYRMFDLSLYYLFLQYFAQSNPMLLACLYKRTLLSLNFVVVRA